MVEERQKYQYCLAIEDNEAARHFTKPAIMVLLTSIKEKISLVSFVLCGDTSERRERGGQKKDISNIMSLFGEKMRNREYRRSKEERIMQIWKEGPKQSMEEKSTKQKVTDLHNKDKAV